MTEAFWDRLADGPQLGLRLCCRIGNFRKRQDALLYGLRVIEAIKKCRRVETAVASFEDRKVVESDSNLTAI